MLYCFFTFGRAMFKKTNPHFAHTKQVAMRLPGASKESGEDTWKLLVCHNSGKVARSQGPTLEERRSQPRREKGVAYFFFKMFSKMERNARIVRDQTI